MNSLRKPICGIPRCWSRMPIGGKGSFTGSHVDVRRRADWLVAAAVDRAWSGWHRGHGVKYRGKDEYNKEKSNLAARRQTTSRKTNSRYPSSHWVWHSLCYLLLLSGPRQTADANVLSSLNCLSSTSSQKLVLAYSFSRPVDSFKPKSWLNERVGTRTLPA